MILSHLFFKGLNRIPGRGSVIRLDKTNVDLSKGQKKRKAVVVSDSLMRGTESAIYQQGENDGEGLLI